MFIFESPLNLLLLLGIPSGIYLRHISPRRGGRIPFPIKIWKGSAPRVPVRLRALLLFSHTCFWLGIAGLVLVLSGPGIAHKQRIYLNRGIDIMLVVDVSPSMAIQDFGQQSRLEVTRKLLKDFVMTRENDAIGIVSFGRDAALRVSPTIDHGAVLGAIDQLAIFDHGDASAMGLALSIATLHLQYSTADHQVIIFITDGDNNAGEVAPHTAAGLLQKAGIKLYTIGIGGDEAAPIEFVYPDTGTAFRGTMADSYDIELLQSIADTSGGQLYTAESMGTLAAIMREIDSLELVESRVRVAVASYPLYRYFLVAALLLLLVDFIIRTIVLREVL